MKFPGADLLRSLFRGSSEPQEDGVVPETPENGVEEALLPPTIPVGSSDDAPRPKTRAAARALAQAKALAESSPSIRDEGDDRRDGADGNDARLSEEQLGTDPDSGANGTITPDSRVTSPVKHATPSSARAADKPVTRSQRVGEHAATWRAELVELAGSSPLVDTSLLGDAQIDITHAHPSGQAQLYAGRTTRLSNLVRERGQLSTARKRASRVQIAAEDLGQRFGIAPAYLAIGVATWSGSLGADASPEELEQVAEIQAMTAESSGLAQNTGNIQGLLTSSKTRETGAVPLTGRILRAPVDPPKGTPLQAAPADMAAETLVHAPVLLRPVRLVPRDATGSDYDLTLEESLEINPVLLRALEEFGSPVDARALTQAAFTGNGFNPGPTLERLRELGAEVLSRFEISDSLLVGTFVNPGQSLVDDLDEHTDALERHELVAAIAGDPEAIASLQVILPAVREGDVDPAQDVGIGDLEPDQIQIVRAAATGAHLLLDAPPGANCAGTVAALIGDAVARGRNVLYVSAHRRSTDALIATLRDLGATDLALDTYPTPAQGRDPVVRSLLAGLTASGGPPRIDHTTDPAVRHAGLRAELVELRSMLNGYVKALHTPRFPWHVSAYEALQALARLTSTRPAPRTTVRLDAETVRNLDSERRVELCTALVEAWDLGAFDDATSRTAWFGAAIDSKLGAERALGLVDDLHDQLIPANLERIDAVANFSGIWAARSMNQWEAQLRMFDGVRKSLDIFTPVVFERSAKDLVAATATKEWREERGIEMSGRVRRRLRKQAEDLIRPGTTVDDLHSKLIEAQARREQWEKFSAVGGWPRLPEDLAEAEREFEVLARELNELTQLLAAIEGATDLREMPFDQITIRLGELRRDSAAMETLPGRTKVLADLAAAGLQELVDDIRDRLVERDLLAKELELAWWSSLFESIVTEVPELAGYDGEALATLTDRYRAVDVAHVETLVELPIMVADQRRRAAVHGRPDTAEAFFSELIDGRLVSLRDVVTRYREVARSIRPCWIASPMLVPQTAEPGRNTDLLILDVEQDLPTSHAIAAIARAKQVIILADSRRSRGGIVKDVAGLLPSLPIRASRSRRDPRLTMFLAEHGYGDAMVPVPLPDSDGLIQLILVDGMGMPAPGGDTVESVRAEVDAAVDLVLDHAMTRPEESLAVVTISPLHAVNVRDAVYAEVRRNPAMAEFFAVDKRMPFTVVDALSCGGLQRDAIILSLGYAKTPHGRVLHRFGPISDPYGDHILRAALATTEHRLTIVSSIAAEDLDPDRMRAAGPKMLVDLLRLAEASRYPEAEAALTMPDSLLVDLAERVWRQGIDVIPNVAFPGGPRIPLAVGHPDLPDRLLMAVLTDDDAYVAEQSLRVRDRQAVERLTRRGWAVMHEWASSVFLDPQAEADAVVAAALAGRDRVLSDPATKGARLRASGSGTRDRARSREALDRAAALVPVVVEAPADGPLPSANRPPVSSEAIEVSVTPEVEADIKAPNASTLPAASFEDSSPDDTVPDDTAPDDTVPDDTVPGDAAPDDTVPDAAVSPDSQQVPDIAMASHSALPAPTPRIAEVSDRVELDELDVEGSGAEEDPPAGDTAITNVSEASSRPAGSIGDSMSDLHGEIPSDPAVAEAAKARLDELASPLSGPIPIIDDVLDLADGAWNSVMGPAPSRSGDGGGQSGAGSEGADAGGHADSTESGPSETTPGELANPVPIRESVLSVDRGKRVTALANTTAEPLDPAPIPAATSGSTSPKPDPRPVSQPKPKPVPTAKSVSATGHAEPQIVHRASDVLAEHDRYLPELEYENEDGVPNRLEPRPMVVAGLPISAYSDDQLDDLVGWIASDGALRSAEEMAAAVREELGVVRRNARIDAVIAIAVQRRG